MPKFKRQTNADNTLNSITAASSPYAIPSPSVATSRRVTRSQSAAAAAAAAAAASTSANNTYSINSVSSTSNTSPTKKPNPSKSRSRSTLPPATTATSRSTRRLRARKIPSAGRTDPTSTHTSTSTAPSSLSILLSSSPSSSSLISTQSDHLSTVIGDSFPHHISYHSKLSNQRDSRANSSKFPHDIEPFYISSDASHESGLDSISHSSSISDSPLLSPLLSSFEPVNGPIPLGKSLEISSNPTSPTPGRDTSNEVSSPSTGLVARATQLVKNAMNFGRRSISLKSVSSVNSTPTRPPSYSHSPAAHQPPHPHTVGQVINSKEFQPYIDPLTPVTILTSPVLQSRPSLSSPLSQRSRLHPHLSTQRACLPPSSENRITALQNGKSHHAPHLGLSEEFSDFEKLSHKLDAYDSENQTLKYPDAELDRELIALLYPASHPLNQPKFNNSAALIQSRHEILDSLLSSFDESTRRSAKKLLKLHLYEGKYNEVNYEVDCMLNHIRNHSNSNNIPSKGLIMAAFLQKLSKGIQFSNFPLSLSSLAGKVSHEPTSSKSRLTSSDDSLSVDGAYATPMKTGDSGLLDGLNCDRRNSITNSNRSNGSLNSNSHSPSFQLCSNFDQPKSCLLAQDNDTSGTVELFSGGKSRRASLRDVLKRSPGLTSPLSSNSSGSRKRQASESPPRADNTVLTYDVTESTSGLSPIGLPNEGTWSNKRARSNKSIGNNTITRSTRVLRSANNEQVKSEREDIKAADNQALTRLNLSGSATPNQRRSTRRGPGSLIALWKKQEKRHEGRNVADRDVEGEVKSSCKRTPISVESQEKRLYGQSENVTHNEVKLNDMEQNDEVKNNIKMAGGTEDKSVDTEDSSSKGGGLKLVVDQKKSRTNLPIWTMRNRTRYSRKHLMEQLYMLRPGRDVLDEIEEFSKNKLDMSIRLARKEAEGLGMKFALRSAYGKPGYNNAGVTEEILINSQAYVDKYTSEAEREIIGKIMENILTMVDKKADFFSWDDKHMVVLPKPIVRHAGKTYVSIEHLRSIPNPPDVSYGLDYRFMAVDEFFVEVDPETMQPVHGSESEDDDDVDVNEDGLTYKDQEDILEDKAWDVDLNITPRTAKMVRFRDPLSGKIHTTRSGEGLKLEDIEERNVMIIGTDSETDPSWDGNRTLTVPNEIRSNSLGSAREKDESCIKGEVISNKIGEKFNKGNVSGKVDTLSSNGYTGGDKRTISLFTRKKLGDEGGQIGKKLSRNIFETDSIRSRSLQNPELIIESKKEKSRTVPDKNGASKPFTFEATKDSVKLKSENSDGGEAEGVTGAESRNETAESVKQEKDVGGLGNVYKFSSGTKIVGVLLGKHDLKWPSVGLRVADSTCENSGNSLKRRREAWCDIVGQVRKCRKVLS